MTIGVTGLNANDNPGPGVAVIRALRAHFGQDIRIIGLGYESLEPGIYLAGIVDKTYQIPYPASGTSALKDRLLYVNEHENLNMIIPNFDAELFNFIKIAPWLESIGIKTFLPTHEQLNVRDKINLFEFGEKYGFKVPADKKIFNITDLENVIDELGYPLVIKGKYYEAVVSYNKEIAITSFHQLSSKWGFPVIAQQFIKGIEINIAALGDGKGNAISVIPMRKLYLTEKGKAWAGITIEDKELIELAERFCKVTKWRGGFELEIMKDADGNLFIMEINPRFPAWVFLTAGAGQNQPAAMVNMAMGDVQIPYTEYIVGKNVYTLFMGSFG